METQIREVVVAMQTMPPPPCTVPPTPRHATQTHRMVVDKLVKPHTLHDTIR